MLCRQCRSECCAGRLTCSNLACLVSVFLMPGLPRGTLGERQRCSGYSGNCLECGKMRKWTQGIFCANFAWSVDGFPKCHGMWCGSCYASSNVVEFCCQTSNRADQELTVNGERSNLWGHKKPDPLQFHTARDGDHLLTPFQCDLCVFRRVMKRDPDVASHADQLAAAHMRRANLDAFWGRATGTANTNRRIVNRNLDDMAVMGSEGPYFDPGPTLAHDHSGHETAMGALADARKVGKHSSSHKQHQSSRKVKLAVGNFEKLHSHHPLACLTLVDEEKGRTTRFHFGGNSSLWYDRFAQGCRARMGEDVCLNLALSTDLWKAFLRKCERRAWESTEFNEGARFVTVGAFSCFSLVSSLRGPEGFMFETSLLNQHRELNNGLAWLPIIGKLKGDSKEKTHCLRSVPITGSGINVWRWRDWLVTIHATAGRTSGPAICDGAGHLLTARSVNEVIWDLLEELYDEGEVKFPMAASCKDDIRELIELDRSFCRSSESRATRMGVSQPDKDIVNRWSKEVKAKGKKPSEALSTHYADQQQLDDCFRRCTQAQ